MLRIIKLGMIVGAMALFANTAEAATLFFVPEAGNYGIDQDISVDLKINSGDVGINAAQATIRFPKDILNVKSVDKTGSTFNFWLEEPTFSNTDGVITFIAGTPYGVSGASLQAIHIVFTTKSAGAAPVTITDAAISASDGTGSNVLSKSSNAQFQVVPAETTAALLPVPPPAPLPPPVQIVRTPVAAVGLPGKPTVAVSLYPDATAWYNLSNVFTAGWILPPDITGVSTAINKQPNFTPGQTSEGLFDSKSFAALSDGTWYLHVRFKNNIGWGATTHYRIAIDTQPPLPFEVTSNDGDATDNPTPAFIFKTGDPMSGLARYQARIDKGDWVQVPLKDFKGTFTFLNLAPGKHHITVQAVDLAGNSIEGGIDHETLAIASPTFTFVTDKLYSNEARGLTLRGTSLPGTKILLSIKKGSEVLSSAFVPVNADGNWEYTSSSVLLSGRYTASIQAEDSRGALSLVVDSTEISVTGKYTNLIIGVIVILVLVIFCAVWFYERRRERTALRIQVAESDTAKVFKMIEDDVEKLKKAQKTETTADDEFLTNKLNENVKKMSGYIKDTINRAK